MVAAAAILAAAAAGLAYWFTTKPAPPLPSMATRVAVLPFDVLSDSSQAKHFSEALTDEIVTRLNSNRIQVVSPEDAATLRGPDRAQRVAELGVALLFDGTVEDDGGIVKVRVHLDDPVRHVTLWSGAADGTSDNRDQVQATIASEIVAVLACSNRALVPAHGLTDPDLLSRYLHACDIFVRGFYSDRDKYDLLASLREVAAKAPDFTPAHSDLAKFCALFRRHIASRAGFAIAQGRRSRSAQGARLGPQVAGCLSCLVMGAAGDGLGGPGKTAAARGGSRSRLAAHQWFSGVHSARDGQGCRKQPAFCKKPQRQICKSTGAQRMPGLNVLQANSIRR